MSKMPKAAKKAAKRKNLKKQAMSTKSSEKEIKATANVRALLARAGELEIQECVISQGWQDRGLAHILITRKTPGNGLLVGGYYVDLYCSGLKSTAAMTVTTEAYETQIKPGIFNDPVDLKPCDPELAAGIIEGAIDFSAKYGFKPHKRWSESRPVLAGIKSKKDEIAFGKDGKPHVIADHTDNLRGVLNRLERTAGAGNYTIDYNEKTADDNQRSALIDD